jgi:hypothetical protein
MAINMNITEAQYIVDEDGINSTIHAIIDGQKMFVPLAPTNRHYVEILKQVEAGTLTIADAD